MIILTLLLLWNLQYIPGRYGIDFTAKKGTNVKAIASGTVKEIKEDLMWGWTAVIEHEGGITAHYCGLQSNLSIKPNQKVDMGEVIGGVGDIPCEVAESEHFHLYNSK